MNYRILQVAAGIGDTKTVLSQINNVADINYRDSEGITPLHNACYSGHKEIVNILLQNGANVVLANNDGQTALHFAVLSYNDDVVKILLQHIKKSYSSQITNFVNAQNSLNGSTPLHLAAEKGCFEIVKCLLQYGAIYNIKDFEGKSPIDTSKDENVIFFLDTIDELFQATQNGDEDFINMKKREIRNSDVSAIENARNKKNQTFLELGKVINCASITMTNDSGSGHSLVNELKKCEPTETTSHLLSGKLSPSPIASSSDSPSPSPIVSPSPSQIVSPSHSPSTKQFSSQFLSSSPEISPSHDGSENIHCVVRSTSSTTSSSPILPIASLSPGAPSPATSHPSSEEWFGSSNDLEVLPSMEDEFENLKFDGSPSLSSQPPSSLLVQPSDLPSKSAKPIPKARSKMTITSAQPSGSPPPFLTPSSTQHHYHHHHHYHYHYFHSPFPSPSTSPLPSPVLSSPPHNHYNHYYTDYHHHYYDNDQH